MNRQLYDLLMSIRPLSPELQAHLLSVLKSKTLRRKEYLLKANQVNDKMCFVERGLLRAYYLKDGREVTCYFMAEKEIVASVTSFYEQKRSFEYLQALEETEVAYITFEELDYIYNNFPEFNFVGRVLITGYFVQWDKRIYGLQMTNAEERFAWLMENKPNLLDRVPAKYIASYLGITPVTLSKIKSEYYRRSSVSPIFQ